MRSPSSFLLSSTNFSILTLAMVLAVVLGTCGCDLVNDAPAAIDAKVEVAWLQAGAETGWLGEQEYRLVFEDQQADLEAPLPAFKFSRYAIGSVKGLAKPQAPFGLQLEKSGIDSVAMTDLSSLKELCYLSVWNTDVDDDGLKPLSQLKKLQKLELGWTDVSDVGMKSLAGLTNLEFLSFYGDPNITGASCDQLAPLTKLVYLDLGETGLTDDGAKHVAKLTKVKQLRISDTNITDAGLREIATLPNLEVLIVEYTPITDAAVSDLSKLTTLKEIYLTGTDMTQAGADDLKSALPACEVDFVPPKKDVGVESADEK